jgi:hypothetical protein
MKSAKTTRRGSFCLDETSIPAVRAGIFTERVLSECWRSHPELAGRIHSTRGCRCAVCEQHGGEDGSVFAVVQPVQFRDLKTPTGKTYVARACCYCAADMGADAAYTTIFRVLTVDALGIRQPLYLARLGEQDEGGVS